MTTEHVSVPRDELEEIARELSKYEAREVAYYARHFGEELQAILSRATPSDGCTGYYLDCGCATCEKREQEKLSAPRVVTDESAAERARSLACTLSINWKVSHVRPSCEQLDTLVAALESFATSLPAANSAKGGSNV